jgi:hypothetical protein
MRNDSKVACAVASRQIELCRLEIRRVLIEKEITSKEYNPIILASLQGIQAVGDRQTAELPTYPRAQRS